MNYSARCDRPCDRPGLCEVADAQIPEALQRNHRTSIVSSRSPPHRCVDAARPARSSITERVENRRAGPRFGAEHRRGIEFVETRLALIVDEPPRPFERRPKDRGRWDRAERKSLTLVRHLVARASSRNATSSESIPEPRVRRSGDRALA